jgi:GR25 family glycosyltransferase involved in LPS biosynthesis
MQKEKAIVCLATIWPQNPSGRSEDFVLRELLKEYASIKRDWILRLVVASAHRSALDVAKRLLAEFPNVEAQFWWMETAYAGTRAEEISFCKEQLPMRLAADSAWDWLYYYDADVWTPIGQIEEWIEAIRDNRERHFVKIKYTLRSKLESPAITLGAYFHHRALLERVEYWKVIFPKDKNGRRIGAPDCKLSDCLDRNGCKKIVPKEMRTLHFLNEQDAHGFDSERCYVASKVRDEAGGWSGGRPPFPPKMRIFRINSPGPIRSRRAHATQLGLEINDVDAVQPKSEERRAREIACSLAHASVMRKFLESDADFAVVLEDDAILGNDKTWMSFTGFDLFMPFQSNRQHREADTRIRHGVVPKWGMFAYLASRAFAVKYAPLLEAGIVADVAHREAAKGLKIGSFVGNAVNHDNQSVSTISEERRRQFEFMGRVSDAEASNVTAGILTVNGTILIGICSATGMKERRDAVRKTWFPDDKNGIRACFFVGSVENAEADVVALDVPDDYKHLPAKVRAFYRYALEHFEFDWLFKCDDDTYVHIERLRELAGTHDLVGNEFLKSSKPFASGGAGYLLSRRAVELLAKDDTLPTKGPEDVILTGRVLAEGLTWKATSRLCWNAKRIPQPSNDVITCHWINPDKMTMIHQIVKSVELETVDVVHPHWRDKIVLYDSGFFSRKQHVDSGTWTRDNKGTLRLAWFNWKPERFAFHTENDSTTYRLIGTKIERIVMRLAGGLGNQMFQYAYGLALARKLGVELAILYVGKDPNRRFALEVFGVHKLKKLKTEHISLISFNGGYKDGILEHLERELEAKACAEVRIKGSFENEKFFLPVAAEIRSKFQLTRNLPEFVAGRTPVAVHVRLGDHESNPTYGACSPNYFSEAFSIMRSRIQNPVFLVFSDEPAKCGAYVPQGDDVHVMPELTDVEAYATMQSCKAFVLSNSTFGWWPAWISNSQYVICPDRYFTHCDWDIFPERWLKLPAALIVDEWKPWFENAEIALVDNWLGNRHRVLEYGSGGSTLRWAHGREWHVVEHDREWFLRLEANLQHRGVPCASALVGPSRKIETCCFGEYPEGYLDAWRPYVEAGAQWGGEFDAVLVDGRARLACARLAVRRLLAADGVILWHDFGAEGRSRYDAILSECEVVERVGTMVVLRPLSPPMADVGVVMAVVEPPEKVAWALRHLRAVYPTAPVAVISDGVDNEGYAPVCAQYGAVYVRGERLKVPAAGGRWWQRTLEAGLGMGTRYVLKVDPDTRFNRPVRSWPAADCFGNLLGEGKRGELIQGGIQGFQRSAVERIVTSGICLREEFRDVQSWAFTDKERAKFERENYLSTDRVLIRVLKDLGMSREHWHEVVSPWGPAPADAERFAISHWHK